MRGALARVPRAGAFFWKLYGTYVAVVLVSAATVGGLVFGFFERNERANLRARLTQLAELLASLEAANPQELWTPIAQNRADELALSSGAEIDIVLGDGRVAASTRLGGGVEDPLALPEFEQAALSGAGEVFRRESGEDFESLHVTRAIVIHSEHIGYVRVSKSLGHLMPEVRRLGGQILIGSALAASVSLIGGVVFGRTVTRPLEAIERGCLRILEGEYRSPIGLNRSDEFGVVADVVNRMAESLTCQLGQIERQRNRSELLLRLLDDGVLAIDGDGRVAFMNASAEPFCRSGTSASCVGRHYREVLAVEPARAAVREAMAEGRELKRGVSWSEGCGQPRYAAVSVSPLEGEEHDLVGWLLVIRDTTERRRFEALRRDFASNVSHELKTPITAIASLIEALKGGAAAETDLRESFLERIRLQNERMKRLVDELLAISRLESGDALLTFESCDLREAFASARDTFLPLAEQRGIRYSVEMPEEPIRGRADMRALELVVNSLIDNAFKFTPPGGEIRATLRREGGSACIEVSDTGCGIPKEHQGRVFERFYRIESSRNRSSGGSGLGLAIVKHMSLAHGGEVSLESEVGRGSRFRVRIPLEPRPILRNGTSS